MRLAFCGVFAECRAQDYFAQRHNEVGKYPDVFGVRRGRGIVYPAELVEVGECAPGTSEARVLTTAGVCAQCLDRCTSGSWARRTRSSS